MIGTRFSGAFLSLAVATLSACSSGGGTTDAGCQAETDQAFCVRLGKNCDSFNGFDNCGSSRAVNCGTCEGICQQNLCQSGSTSGSSSGGTTTGTTTAGGTTGGATTGGTTGGTTGAATTGGGNDGGCTSTDCGGYANILTASFVLDSYGTQGGATLDPLVGEHLTMIVGFNSGPPLDAGAEEYFASSTVMISVSGDDAGYLAAHVLPTWIDDGGINISEDGTGNVDLELRPSDQSGAWFGLEFQCLDLPNTGGPLVTADCLGSAVTLRYFGTPEFDALSTTAAPTISLYVIDGGS